MGWGLNLWVKGKRSSHTRRYSPSKRLIRTYPYLPAPHWICCQNRVERYGGVALSATRGLASYSSLEISLVRDSCFTWAGMLHVPQMRRATSLCLLIRIQYAVRGGLVYPDKQRKNIGGRGVTLERNGFSLMPRRARTLYLPTLLSRVVEGTKPRL